MAEDFTYIVARLRAIEASMPDRSWFERLVRVPQDSLLTSIREFYPAFEGVDSPYDFEQGLAAEKKAFLDLLTSLLSEENSRTFIRAGYDFDNVRHAWKASKMGYKAQALVPYGLVDPSVVQDAISGKIRSALPDYLELLIESLEREFNSNASLSVAEYVAEAMKMKFLLGKAPDDEAARYIRWKIDLTNIKNLLRLRIEPVRRVSLEKAFCECGEIEVERFVAFLKAPLEEFQNFLATSSYRRLLALGISGKEPMWKTDVAIRCFLMESLGESKYRHFDFSPVLYHLELRERNEGIIRRVITSKLNRLPERVIMSRLESLLAA